MDKAKVEIKTIAEKNRIINRIGDEILKGESFLLLGHKDPETDCIASLVSFALLLSNFQKDITIYLAGPVTGHFTYLLAICKYRGVSVAYGKLPDRSAFTTMVIVDTPKPEMLTLNDQISALLKDTNVCKIEIDHHLGSDAQYSGDEGYRLVSTACSTCELIGQLLLKMTKQKDKFGEIAFSKNLMLAIITGIIGDSQVGKYLKTRREKLYYRIFTDLFYKMMGENAQENKNLSSMEAVFDVIQNFSVREKQCFGTFMAMKHMGEVVHYIPIGPSKSLELFKSYGAEFIVNISHAVVDALAETSGALGLVAYFDDPSLSDFVQFHLRRSVNFLNVDLRSVLTELKIENGGGHPGAVGFRIKKEAVADIDSYVEDMVNRIEALL
jgi:nanoRNase/pAp phosphatase (c-di-AMP/oligoRNAs hydrolase)